MRWTSIVGGAALALFATTSFATESPPPQEDPRIEHERYVLDNGLEVILVPDGTVPLVAVSVWYHVGSGLESPGKSGFAHLFEHMLFQGSENVGMDKHFDILKKMGSSNVNGTTNPDRTNYFEVVPSNQLEAVLWLESDRMGYFLPLVTEESLKNQIDVVRNERRQRVDNVPYGPSSLKLWEMLFPENHPYRYQTIGRHEDLENASLEDVRNFYKTWYVPANATLSIAGDFDVQATKALVQKWFGSFPASEKPSVVPVPVPKTKPQRAEVEDRFAKLRQVTWAWNSPGAFAPGDAELELVASVLGGGEASRLNKLLVIDKQLAQSVRASQSSMGFSGIFSVTVTLRSDADLATVEKLVAGEIAKLRDEAVSERERARAVTRIENVSVYRLEDLRLRGERLQMYNHYLGDPDRLSWDLDRYRAVTTAQMREWTQTYLDTSNAVVLVTVPAGGAQ